jgi:hypothetical protein
MPDSPHRDLHASPLNAENEAIAALHFRSDEAVQRASLLGRDCRQTWLEAPQRKPA